MAVSPYPSPADWRDIWIYMILVDRFNNPAGPPAGGVPWDQPYPGGYRGGTLGGVQAKLDYLQQLGAKAIWLSPVLKNCSYLETYHGYGIQDFTQVEPRFTSDPAATRANPDLGRQELHDLVEAAHDRKMFVILDIVLNHTGDVFAYPGDADTAGFSSVPYPVEWRDAQGIAHPEWPEPPADPAPDAVVWPAALQHSDYFTRQGTAQDTIGDFDDLRQLNTVYQDGDRFRVRDALITAYADIIRTFDIDGFRVDTLKYLAGDTPLVFGNAMREVALTLGKRNFFTFGEVYDSEDTISRFIGRRTSMPGDDPSVIGIDAALDYPLFYVLPDVAKGLIAPSSLSSMYSHRLAVQDGLLSSHGEASRYYVSFLDNHDQTSRFYYDDGQGTYDRQVPLGLALLWFLPGIPCLYYGTEAGLHGSGGNESVREALWGDPAAFALPDLPFTQAVQQFSAIRDANPALRYGRHYTRPISGDGQSFGTGVWPGGVVAFSRILYDTEALVVANTNPASSWNGDVIVDRDINPSGSALSALWPAGAPSLPVSQRTNVTVAEPDGSTGTGPLSVVTVQVPPMTALVAISAPSAGF